MLVLIGFVVVVGSILGGFIMHGGNLMVLMQTSEFVIIGGAGLGALIIANKPSTLKSIISECLGLLKGDEFDEEAYMELLEVLYQVFYKARREGLVGIESDVENPEQSELFAEYPGFREHHHAVSFLTDTLKVLLTGAVEEHNLAEILDLDLEQRHESSMAASRAIRTLGDAMPGFGIVAAVLGVIITMGHIGGAPEVIGKKIAAALVGTFLGVLGAYGVLLPLADAIASRAESEDAYLNCIRTALLSFARGDSPITSVEFARRVVETEERPSFAQLEKAVRGGGGTGGEGAREAA